MKREQKEKAVELPSEKIAGKVVTYKDIPLVTGHGTRQPKMIREEGTESALAHGNGGSTPHSRSRTDEVSYPREPEKPYPNAAIAHLGDACFGDVP